MKMVYMSILLDLPYAQSLKGRRSIVNSIIDKLKRKNLSVLDVSGSYTKEAEIAIAYLSPNSIESAKLRRDIEDLLESKSSEYIYDIVYEEI